MHKRGFNSTCYFIFTEGTSCALPNEIKHCQFDPIDGWFNEELTLECLTGFWFSRDVSNIAYRCTEDGTWVDVIHEQSINQTTQCVGRYSQINVHVYLKTTPCISKKLTWANL